MSHQESEFKENSGTILCFLKKGEKLKCIGMGDLQVTQEVVVELAKFHNVDLFQRGYYQIRCTLKQPLKIPCIIECEQGKCSSDAKNHDCLFPSFVNETKTTGVSKTYEVYYKHEECSMNDVFIFKLHMLLDSQKIELQYPKHVELDIDLYFGDCHSKPSSGASLTHASTQTLRIHLKFLKSFHHHRPILFDYFHLGSVTLTVHSCLVAIRQPWLGSLQALNPALATKGASSRQYLYCALFGKNPPLSSEDEVTPKQRVCASFLHKRISLILLKFYANLLQYFHHAMTFLPDYAQMRVSQPDVEAKMEVLSNEFENMKTADDIYIRMGDDLYLLSTELSMLWSQFLEQFSLEGFLISQMRQENHRQRMEHLAEAFLMTECLWHTIAEPEDQSGSRHIQMANKVKSSSYYQQLPPVKLECIALDGDSQSMPIVFEERYIPNCSEASSGVIRPRLSIEESMFEDYVDLDISLEENDEVLELSGIDTGVPDDKLELGDEIFTYNRGDDHQASYIGPGAPPASPTLTYFGKTKKSGSDTSGSTFVSHITQDSEGTAKVSESDDGEVSINGQTEKTDKGDGLPDATESDTLLESKGTEAPQSTRQPEHRNGDQIKPPKDLYNQSGVVSPVGEPSGLMACFPPLKSGTSRSRAYKIALSATNHLENSRDISRFELSKQHLKLSLSFTGELHSDIFNPRLIKPYFTERISSNLETCHLVICVHGLDGNSGDLRLVKCYLEMALPKANLNFMMSEVNQDDTFLDIDELTGKLVSEIIFHIESNTLDPVKISFVGHSLGNVIVRNAVVHAKLMQFRGKFHTFLSLSGPHLGMSYQTSSLVSTGLWLMQKWKKGGSLSQLSLNDSSDLRDTFMYRLSLTNGFQYFKNVLLVGSVQDHYVPFHSARLEMCKQATKDSSDLGRVYREMLNNILKPLEIQEEVNIIRYSVHHVIPASANSFIGRAAHIAMLDSELFIEKLLLISACKYFR